MDIIQENVQDSDLILIIRVFLVAVCLLHNPCLYIHFVFTIVFRSVSIQFFKTQYIVKTTV